MLGDAFWLLDGAALEAADAAEESFIAAPGTVFSRSARRESSAESSRSPGC